MGWLQIKTKLPKISFVTVGLLASLLFASQSFAATNFPYFSVNNGDVFAGGGFNDSNGSAYCLNNFTGPTYSPSWDPTKANTGGIMAFVNSSFPTRSGTNQGAFSLGIISNAGGESSSQYGFYSAGNASNSLSLANNKGSSSIANYFGGLFENASLNTNFNRSTTNCIPDYYDSKINSATNDMGSVASINLSILSSGGYKATPSGSYVTISGSLSPSENISLFINGNALVNGNITYSGSYDDTHVPKLRIVAKGDIYFNPSGITQPVSGFYIAQQNNSTSKGGNIFTCYDGSQTMPLASAWLYTNCNNSLTINGALVAQKIQLIRLSGDLNTAGNAAAEQFNFTPEMVVGGGFDQTSTSGSIQSLVNLPPVF